MDLVLSSLPLPLRLRSETPLSDLELLWLSEENRQLRMEREQNGDVLLMTPTGSQTGNKNIRIRRLLDEWAERDGRGIGYESNTGFKLASGAVRSPDAAWMANERLQALTEAQLEGFGPLCPDFVIELVSPSDKLTDLKRKIVEEWMGNGVQLAWLIDVKKRIVSIYRAGEEPETLVDPTSARGTGPVRGFELVMARVWG